MYKIKAKQDYTDKKPELIEKFYGEKIEYDKEGNARIKKGNVYLINNKERATQIKESGLANVEEIKEEVETATVKTKTETAIKKSRKKSK